MNSFYSLANTRKKRFFLDWSLTWQLILINVVLFLVFSLLSILKVLPLEFVALNPSFIFEKGYYWTFLTSMFMHAGILHLFVNMLSLFFIGNLLEKILGKRRFFWIYLISGLFAGLFFVLLSFIIPGDYSSFAVGASGALFGLMGVLVFLTPNLRVYLMFIPIPIRLKYAAPVLLVGLWFISLAGNIPIGNTAHLGGLIAGVIYGLYLRFKFPKKVKMIDGRFS
jgi:membrane associated rhomboid family serine protease